MQSMSKEGLNYFIVVTRPDTAEGKRVGPDLLRTALARAGIIITSVNSIDPTKPLQLPEVPQDEALEGLRRILQGLTEGTPLGKVVKPLRESGWQAPLEELSKRSGMDPDQVRNMIGAFGNVFAFNEETNEVSCPLFPTDVTI